MYLGGKAIGDECPVCQRGRLLPVLRDLAHARSGHVIAADIPIERLACGNCAVSCEARDRGKTLREVRERQLIRDFLNPEAEPRTCAACGADEVLHATRMHVLATYDTRYRYCGDCHTVLWVDGAKQWPKKAEAVVAHRPAVCA